MEPVKGGLLVNVPEEVKNVLTEIMNDEIQHIWRLTDLVMLLDKNWETQLKAAEKEGENE